MFSVSPEIYRVLSVASRWLFAFFALMLLLFACSWHHADRKERRDRFKNLPGAGTVGELVVLSGDEYLPPDTWFPVPREGVLGSLRSCDLVVPCPGVRSQHLDFSWQDGTGLLIRPRNGCEAFVDGVPVTRRNRDANTPLLHGSVLQVGSAVLKLQLFSALSHTNRTFVPPAPVPYPPQGSPEQPFQSFFPAPVPQDQGSLPPSASAAQGRPMADGQFMAFPVRLPSDQAGAPVSAPAGPGRPLPDEQFRAYPAPFSPDQAPAPDSSPAASGQPMTDEQRGTAAPQRRSRADRWKEDWSE